MRFQREMVFQVCREIGNLLERHHEESCPDGYPLSPDWKRYRSLEEAGCLCLISARDDQELVGYATAFVTPHPHSTTSMVALGDMVYLVPEKRLGPSGIQLIKTAERECEKMGAKSITWNAKLGTVLEDLLPLIGYGPEEVVWLKQL